MAIQSFSWALTELVKLQQRQPDLVASALDRALRDNAKLKWSLIVNAYLDETINLGKAAELLGVHRLELQDRFAKLGVPIRVGSATIEEARAEVESLRRSKQCVKMEVRKCPTPPQKKLTRRRTTDQTTRSVRPISLARLQAERANILRVASRRGARAIRVFGSVARGDADMQSDVDFLVDLEPGRSLFDLGGLLMDLQSLLGCRVDVVTENGLRERIRARILKEAVLL
ncbi:MAG: nucleotidyltransferase domain-containing protein [Chloroflexi bacterium]|nr:nucleotidyltransferase domain-containing protein [Chloroflexota bacterium]